MLSHLAGGIKLEIVLSYSHCQKKKRFPMQGPRKCEYNGRLYCHECHRGDLAELPSQVLHHWDFNLQPVSAMAADYLTSISDRPLLCIGAVNPGMALD